MINYNELQKKIFDFSYGAALGDAIGQKAFEGNKKSMRNNEEAKCIARQYIDDIINGKNPDFYKTAKELEKSFTRYIEENKSDIAYKRKDGNLSNPVFRFGNAQKLINMLSKNMFLLVYQNEALRSYFNQCHCPMDNVMIENVKKALEKINNEEATALWKRYKNSGNLAWSRIESENIEQYEAFQACVKFLADKEGLSLVEYDYWYWKDDE